MTGCFDFKYNSWHDLNELKLKCKKNCSFNLKGFKEYKQAMSLDLYSENSALLYLSWAKLLLSKLKVIIFSYVDIILIDRAVKILLIFNVASAFNKPVSLI